MKNFHPLSIEKTFRTNIYAKILSWSAFFMKMWQKLANLYFVINNTAVEHALFTKRSSCISWPPYDLHLIYFWSHFPRKKHKIEKSPYSRRAIPAAVWNVAKYVFWDNSRCLQTDLHLHLTPAKLLTNV